MSTHPQAVEQPHNRARCPLTNEDIAIWIRLQSTQGRFWAALLTLSVRCDHMDARIMGILSKHRQEFRKVDFLFVALTNKGPLQ